MARARRRTTWTRPSEIRCERAGAIASGSEFYRRDQRFRRALQDRDGNQHHRRRAYDGPSQTGSYTIDTTTGDDDTDAMTGTETLGGGGTISGGSDTVSWSDGNWCERDLEINGIERRDRTSRTRVRTPAALPSQAPRRLPAAVATCPPRLASTGINSVRTITSRPGKYGRGKRRPLGVI